MKFSPSKHYHLFLLGASIALTLGTGIYLTMASSALQSSLEAQRLKTAGKSFEPDSPKDAMRALDILQKTTIWKMRADGASPFVSRPYLIKDGALLDPLMGDKPLYPPVPNKWLADHQLDFSDINILDRDPLHKGFTILEEYQAGTDPNDPKQLPPLHTRLYFQTNDINKTEYLLEFLGEEENEGKKEILIKPISALPNPERGNKPDNAIRHVRRGEAIPGVPFLQVGELIPKKKSINDTEYDVDELTLLNTLTGERHILVKKFISKEYHRTPIQVIEGVKMTYQPAGTTPQEMTAPFGKTITLTSLDNSRQETYRFTGVASDGLQFERDGKVILIKPSSPPSPPSAAPSPAQQ